MMNFGEKLQMLRQKDDISRDFLAKVLGISYSTVAKYELGERFPEKSILKKISEYFNVSLDYLIDKDSTIFSQVTNVNTTTETTANIDYNYKIWKNIYSLCKVLDISLERLASDAPIDIYKFINIKKGLEPPSPEVLKKLYYSLANTYEVSDKCPLRVDLSSLYNVEIDETESATNYTFYDSNDNYIYSKLIQKEEELEHNIFRIISELKPDSHKKINEVVLALYKHYKAVETEK
jgi:transcriptional regulator with XRE-family HTH domain